MDSPEQLHPLLSTLTVEYHASLSSIPGKEWTRIAESASPLLQWDWLANLEQSGSVAASSDWQPQHISVRDKGLLIAAAPLYRREHSSNGEFVFDFAWADAADQLGFDYYPKLVGMSPASPVPAFEILVDSTWCARNKIEPAELQRWVSAEICMHAVKNGIHSVHLQYVRPYMREITAGLGFQEWRHAGFTWFNRGYSSWDDFLLSLSKDRRRNARRERRKLRESGIHVQILRGNELPAEWQDTMYRFYRNTNDQFGPWAARFLTREFFLHILQAGADNLLFAVASDEAEEHAEPIAMAMFLIRGKELFGRYWGCRKTIPFLHFECCYYAPIEWAISNNIQRFDPGMGGEHKIHRGFEGITNYSLHWFQDPRMGYLFKENIHQFNDFTEMELAAAAQMSPLLPDKETTNHE